MALAFGVICLVLAAVLFLMAWQDRGSWAGVSAFWLTFGIMALALAGLFLVIAYCSHGSPS